jgi:hypothetical protein
MFPSFKLYLFYIDKLNIRIIIPRFCILNPVIQLREWNILFQSISFIIRTILKIKSIPYTCPGFSEQRRIDKLTFDSVFNLYCGLQPAHISRILGIIDSFAAIYSNAAEI